MRQISREAEEVNQFLGAIANVFLEADADMVEKLAEGEFQCSLWQGNDQREWTFGFSKEWQLVSINFFHTAGQFVFEYQISKDGEEDPEQVYDLYSQEIAMIRGHLNQLLMGTLAKFPDLREPMEVYVDAARRAGFG